MKGLVVYDSYYGNTQRVAETIAEELRTEGHEAELMSVRDKRAAKTHGDILFVGSPVRMGSTTGKAKRYIKHLDEAAWEGKPIVVFTTVLELPENPTDAQKHSREAYDLAAGRKLGDLARSRGLNALQDLLWVEVAGMKGPLVDTGIQKTRQFTRELLSNPQGQREPAVAPAGTAT